MDSEVMWIDVEEKKAGVATELPCAGRSNYAFNGEPLGYPRPFIA
jgi:hypothetical protein